MKPPRSLDDLPFATHLVPHAGDDLEDAGDYDRVRFGADTFPGGVLSEATAGGARFIEVAFTDVTFDGGRLRRARLSDAWFGRVRMVGTDLAESSMTDTWLHDCVLAGVQSFSLIGRRMTFAGCKLDSVNFRGAELTDVTFADCVLREPDFGGAKLTRVAFGGCQLVGAEFNGAACRDVDLVGATLGGSDSSGADAPGIRSGYDCLRGCRIDSAQLMTLAPLLARHLGLTVDGA